MDVGRSTYIVCGGNCCQCADNSPKIEQSPRRSSTEGKKGGSVYINSNNTGIVSRNRSTPMAPAASFDIYTIMEKCDENMEHK